MYIFYALRWDSVYVRQWFNNALSIHVLFLSLSPPFYLFHSKIKKANTDGGKNDERKVTFPKWLVSYQSHSIARVRHMLRILTFPFGTAKNSQFFLWISVTYFFFSCSSSDRKTTKKKLFLYLYFRPNHFVRGCCFAFFAILVCSSFLY